MLPATNTQRIAAEFVGTALLLAVVVGSGIMGEKLSGGNAAVALLGNSIATGAGLYVLITILAPVSGAYFNPVVSITFWRSGTLSAGLLAAYVCAQLTGGVIGVWVTHAMFDMPLLQFSTNIRSGVGQWISECIATGALLAVIHLGLRNAAERVPLMVALIVTAGYWFTASTFFANPAVTLARALSDSFAGIRPGDVAGFTIAQLIACVIACIWLRPR